MALICKRQPNQDRISNLPNNLITHILSFLSTKYAVKTSLLSTSWNQQWTLLPFIRIDNGLRYPRFSPSFVNFVYRVLLYKVTPLDLFQLTNGDYDALNVSNWISFALSRHARHVDVRATMPSRCLLPDSLYASKTLVVLELSGNFVLRVPEKVSLDSLKIFHYSVADFEGDESFSRLVSSCPVLEELEIMGKLRENVKVLNISSLALKRLILMFLYSIRFSENGEPHAYELALNTPRLEYLEHNDEDGVPDHYHITTLQCLNTARLSLNLSHCDLEEYDIEPLIPARSMVELVVAISNVRALFVLENSFEALYSTALPNFELPKFHRLIYLELGRIESDAGLRLLIAFLQSSPKLEYLSCYLNCSNETWDPPRDVPFCMIYNLQVIEVDYFDEEEPLLDVVTYFLEKTNCLEELIILRPEKKDKEFIKKVSTLPKASNSCEIVLS